MTLDDLIIILEAMRREVGGSTEVWVSSDPEGNDTHPADTVEYDSEEGIVVLWPV